MQRNKKEKRSLIKTVAMPALASVAGYGMGSLTGGLAANALFKNKTIANKLMSMSPEKRKRAVDRIRLVSRSVTGVAGALGSAATANYVKRELDKIEKKGSTSFNEKTASVYTVYLQALERTR